MADQKQVLDKVVHDFELVTGKMWCRYDVDKYENIRRDPSLTLEDELNLFRNIMSLMKFKLDDDVRKAVGFNFSLLLVQENGLFKLLMAVFDLDESSQKITTLDQRFMAISNVVCFVPFTCVPFPSYLKLLAPQIHSLFLSRTQKISEHKLTCYRKIGTHIVNGMLTRNKKETVKLLIEPIILEFKSRGGSKLSLDDCVDVFYGLTISNFDVNFLITCFPNLFYARCILDQSLSSKKTKIMIVLQEIMKRIDHSIYLLDDCLFNHFNLAYIYDILTDDKDGSCHLVSQNKATNEPLNIKLIDVVTVVAVDLIESGVQNESKVDLCIHLLDRLSMINIMNPSQGLLLCSFLSTLQERIHELFTQYPTKFIQFVATTLNRYQVPSERIEPEEKLNDDEKTQLMSLQNDSISVAIQILKIIVSEKDKLDRNGVIALKGCVDALGKVIEVVGTVKDDNKEPVDVASLIQLKEEITKLDPGKSYYHNSEKKESLQQALRNLNDPLMPTRAHSLVTIKHLIMAKDSETLENRDRVLELLKSSIADEESYIYLLAVNTLAVLAISQTNHVLPILTSLYLNDHRTIQERINVGEVILHLIKNLGDMAAHYSRSLMDCFYSAITHKEPLIRASGVSNLGQLCSILKYNLKPHLNQIIVGIKCLIQTETDLQVKRAAVMFLHLLLNGIDAASIEVISDQLPDIYRLVKMVNNNCLDDVMRLHSQLAYEQLNRLGKEMLTLREDEKLTRKKKLIQVLD